MYISGSRRKNQNHWSLPQHHKDGAWSDWNLSWMWSLTLCWLQRKRKRRARHSSVCWWVNVTEFAEVTESFAGWLPGDLASSEIHVGISLNRLAGSETGIYRGYQLFEAPMDHAAIVPLSGIKIIESDLVSPSLSRKSRSNRRKSRKKAHSCSSSEVDQL